MSNRFKHLAQSYIEDNKDILTLPTDSSQSPDQSTNLNNSGQSLEPQQNLNFPAVNWNFNTPADTNTFQDDVTTLIEHLAELQVPLAVIQAVTQEIEQHVATENPEPEMMEQNQEMVEPTNTGDQTEVSNLQQPAMPNNIPAI